MVEVKAHITEEKKKEVVEIKRLIHEYKVIGIVNLENLPAFNLMKIKSQLKGKLVLKYSKKRLMKIVFSESEDKNIQELGEKLDGIPALIFTNEDPFKLFQLLKQSKSPALAKPGDKAPRDIVIPAGPTDFTPGPIIGELGQLGIKTSVEGGKVAIKQDKLLVKEGEEINFKNAELMAKLKIEPMEIGLNLILTYGNNEILVRSVLDIDIDEYVNNIKLVAGESVNLAIFTEYITEETVELLIKKAVMEEKGLSNQLNLEISEEKSSDVEEIRAVEAVKELQKFEEKQGSEQIKEEPKEEKKTALEKEIEQEPEQEKVLEDPEDTVKMEQKSPQDTSDEAMKRAEENLKNLINKKMKGEI
ncbi:MAG: 50S ribosomal protein L10 [Nanoarchaeota archaeon]